MKYRVLSFFTLIVLVITGVIPALGQDAAECEAGFRLIEHVAGTDCIPENVERVAVFDTGALELLVALDYAPVVRSAFLEQFQLAVLPDIKDRMTALTGSLPDMGFPINLEVLLEAAPDVIITNSDFAALFPENIETIAPLIVLSRDWEQKLRKTAEVIGETDATEELLAGYESRVETLRDLLAEDGDTLELSLVRVQGEDFILYMPGTFAGTILTTAGLSTPAAQIEAAKLETDNDYFYISRERLDLLDGDVMFLFVAYPDPEIVAASQSLIDSLADDPLFQSLNASKNKTVYQVGGYWYGDGIFSAHRVLDDLFTIIAEVNPAEVSPNPFLAAEPAPEATAES